MTGSAMQTSVRSPSRLQHASQYHPAPQSGSLHLPGLPRFHPANYTHNLASSSPASSPAASPPPSQSSQLSPRQQQRHTSEAQRQLHLYQREMVSRYHGAMASGLSGTRSSASPSGLTPMRTMSPKPTSPRLQPLGSPGPVTPLELEDEQSSASSQLGVAGGSYFLKGGEAGLSESQRRQVVDSFGHTDGRKPSGSYHRKTASNQSW